MTDDYLSPERIDTLFTGIAVGSGRTRAEFDAELAMLGEIAVSDDHLTLLEADDLDGLDPERMQHLDGCGYCRRLVDTIQRPIDITPLVRKLDEELGSRRRAPLVYAVVTIAGVILGVAATEAVNFRLQAEPRLAPSAVNGVSLGAMKETFFAHEVPYGQIIYREARKNRLPPELVAAVVHAESDFQPRLVSDKSAQGLMQIVPDAARALGCRDPFNPEQNIAAGSKYLRTLLDRYGEDPDIALAVYNAHDDVVARFGGVPPPQEEYIRQVRAIAEGYQERVRIRYVAALRQEMAR